MLLLLLLSVDAHVSFHKLRSVSAWALHRQSFCNWCRITQSLWKAQSHWACLDGATHWQGQERIRGERDTTCVTASWPLYSAIKQSEWTLELIQPVRMWTTIYFSEEDHNWVMDMSGKRHMHHPSHSTSAIGAEKMLDTWEPQDSKHWHSERGYLLGVHKCPCFGHLVIQKMQPTHFYEHRPQLSSPRRSFYSVNCSQALPLSL